MTISDKTMDMHNIEDVVVSKDDSFVNNKLFHLISKINKTIDPVDLTVLYYMALKFEKMGLESNINILDEALELSAPFTVIEDLKSLSIQSSRFSGIRRFLGYGKQENRGDFNNE